MSEDNKSLNYKSTNEYLFLKNTAYRCPYCEKIYNYSKISWITFKSIDNVQVLIRCCKYCGENPKERVFEKIKLYKLEGFNDIKRYILNGGKIYSKPIHSYLDMIHNYIYLLCRKEYGCYGLLTSEEEFLDKLESENKIKINYEKFGIDEKRTYSEILNMYMIDGSEFLEFIDETINTKEECKFLGNLMLFRNKFNKKQEGDKMWKTKMELL